jgi:MYXO-CTERM domain-containing protein
MLLLILSSAQAHESDPQYFYLDDTADLLGSAELDSDWMPKDGLLAVRFQIEAEGGADVEMEGESSLSWPTDLNLAFDPTPGSGFIDVDSELGVVVSLKFDIDIYSWESEVASEWVEVSGATTFEPFVLDGGVQDRVAMTAEGRSETIFEYYYDVLAGVASVGFYADLQPQSDLVFQGVAWEVDEGSAEQAGQEIVIPAERQPYYETDAVFVGSWENELNLVFTPVFQVCITVLGCYDIEITEVPLNLVTETFEQEFLPVQLHFPLPVLSSDAADHDFGAIEVGNLANLEVPVTNLGELPLEGTARIVGDSSFTVYPEYFMAGDDTTDGMVVTFSPQAEGVTEATLVISSNDPTAPDLEIALTGEGYTDTSASGSGGDSVSSGVISSCGCASSAGGGAGGLALVTGVLLLGMSRRREHEGGER